MCSYSAPGTSAEDGTVSVSPHFFAFMPYSVHISPSDRIAVLRLFGTVEGKEIVPACLALLHHPDWERGLSTLWDLRDIKTFLFVPEDLAAFEARAAEITALRGDGRTAFVTADSWVQINAHLLGIKTKGDTSREFRVFARMDRAEAWLAEVTSDRVPAS